MSSDMPQFRDQVSFNTTICMHQQFSFIHSAAAKHQLCDLFILLSMQHSIQKQLVL